MSNEIKGRLAEISKNVPWKNDPEKFNVYLTIEAFELNGNKVKEQLKVTLMNPFDDQMEFIRENVGMNLHFTNMKKSEFNGKVSYSRQKGSLMKLFESNNSFQRADSLMNQTNSSYNQSDSSNISQSFPTDPVIPETKTEPTFLMNEITNITEVRVNVTRSSQYQTVSLGVTYTPQIGGAKKGDYVRQLNNDAEKLLKEILAKNTLPK
jgi:hypothetical protein